MPKIVFSPPLPPSIMERAEDMVPDGFDFEIIAEDDPDFLAVVSCDDPYPPRIGLRSHSRVDQIRSVSPEAIAGVR